MLDANPLLEPDTDDGDLPPAPSLDAPPSSQPERQEREEAADGEAPELRADDFGTPERDATVPKATTSTASASCPAQAASPSATRAIARRQPPVPARSPTTCARRPSACGCRTRTAPRCTC